MFYELHLMIRTENRAHRSRKLLLEIELVFARGGDKYIYSLRFTKKEKVTNVAISYLTDQYIRPTTRPSLPNDKIIFARINNDSQKIGGYAAPPQPPALPSCTHAYMDRKS